MRAVAMQFAPIVTALSQPLATVSEAIAAVKGLSIREENIHAQENADLKQWLLMAKASGGKHCS